MIVASDRISAFDVVLPDPIPEKGAILTSISNFWLAKASALVSHHLTELMLSDFVDAEDLTPWLQRRGTVVKRAQPLPFECIVRGYLAGSAWQSYRADRTVCKLSLPAGLRFAEKLPEPIFTPSTKAAPGGHDTNVAFAEVVAELGAAKAEKIRRLSLELYRTAADYALRRGIIIADTKFEFGTGRDGELILIDEVLTPDSSRLWPVDCYEAGKNPVSFDKQFVRDYLESINWNKTAPAPHLPPDVIRKTAEKYRRAQTVLT